MQKLTAVLTMIISLFFTTLCFADNEPFQNERDYLALPTTADQLKAFPTKQVTVIEFFSFGCPACYQLEPGLEQWLMHKPAHVNFYRVPVEFQPAWKVYARSYYVAKQLGVLSKIERPLFKAIHEQHLDLGTPTAMADFFAAQGVDKQKFLGAYEHSPAIDIEMANGRKLINEMTIFQVPGIVIDGKYKVDPSFSGTNTQRLFDTVDYLIAKSARDKGLSTTPSAVAAQKDGQLHTAKSD